MNRTEFNHKLEELSAEYSDLGFDPRHFDQVVKDIDSQLGWSTAGQHDDAPRHIRPLNYAISELDFNMQAGLHHRITVTMNWLFSAPEEYPFYVGIRMA